MVEWTNYAVQLSQQLGLGLHGKPKPDIGADLSVDDLDKFKDDQIVQLYELHKAAKEENDNSTAIESENKTINLDNNEKNKS